MANGEHRILLVDDDKIIRKRLKKLLDQDGHETFTAGDGQKGLEVFDKEDPEIVILDIKMPGMSGIDVLRRIKERSRESEVIMITGHGGVETAIEAMRGGAFGAPPLIGSSGRIRAAAGNEPRGSHPDRAPRRLLPRELPKTRESCCPAPAMKLRRWPR